MNIGEQYINLVRKSVTSGTQEYIQGNNKTDLEDTVYVDENRIYLSDNRLGPGRSVLNTVICL